MSRPRPFMTTTRFLRTVLVVGWGGTLGAGGARAGEAVVATAPAPAPDATALEALQRLKGLDLEANPALKAVVVRVVGTTRGTARYVELVRDFRLVGQEDGLLEVAAKLSGETAGADAVRLLLAGPEGTRVLRTAISSATAPLAQRQALARSLANSADPLGVPLLTAVLGDARSDGVLRATAVQGLARSEPGARELLQAGRAGVLDDAARTTAGLALAQSRWEPIRREAATVLPLPRGSDGESLPPLDELVKLRGDVRRGEAVFRSEAAGCIKCHRVGNDGVDFGPALTEIGTKLARQALYESILDPSAGVSFGYEGWNVETRGGEEVFGILASETTAELVIKLQTGVLVTLPKSHVVRREQQKLSIMPGGLGQILTRHQLVDLVEYLSGLRRGE